MNRKRILVVDDEPNVSTILARGLRKLGPDYIVEAAQDAAEALEKLKSAPYALVITDYRMPKMTGLDLAIAIRDISPETPVVMMTAHGTGSLRKAVDNMALDGYIDKPFTMQQIRQIVKTAVSKTEVDDPYRSGEHYIEDAVSDQMKALQSDTGARCVMLLSAAGYPIETVGTFEGVDTSTVGALVAANFMAAVELSKLLGQHSVFKSSYHEGPDYNIYSYDIDGDVLLAVIFGPETKTGAVWFFTKQTAASLAEMEINAPSGAAIVTEDLDSITEEFEATFSQTEADEIDSVAPNAEDTQNDDGLMDLQDAISAGLVPPELLDLTKAESPDPGDPEAE